MVWLVRIDNPRYRATGTTTVWHLQPGEDRLDPSPPDAIEVTRCGLTRNDLLLPRSVDPGDRLEYRVVDGFAPARPLLICPMCLVGAAWPASYGSQPSQSDIIGDRRNRYVADPLDRPR